MKRIQYHRYGGPDVMKLEDFLPVPLGRHDVLVSVRAASANPMDFGIRAGAMRPVTGNRFPRAMGYDFAGVVEAVGEDVTRLHVGEEVLGGASIRSAGAFAEMVVAKEAGVVHKPKGLSFEEAAALPTPGLTAWQAVVRKGRLERGQKLFVHGCLGSVGRSAVQIALAHGAKVAGSCRDTSRSEADGLGVNPIVDFDFDATALQGGFDVVLDTAGTLQLKAARGMLKRGGRIVSIHPTVPNLARSAAHGSFHVLVTRAIVGDLEDVALLAGDGSLRLPIARSVPLSQAVSALTELELHGLGKRGKLIITPD